MKKIALSELKRFCTATLIAEGMKEEYAALCAEVLSVTDAFGTHSHGTKNLHNYIRRSRLKGTDIKAVPEIIAEGSGFAMIDAHNSMGMISSCQAMELACKKAKDAGIAMVTVKNSTHFGAVGYYVNIAAKQGMFGFCASNVDPNMAAPGGRGMLLGNNPLGYAVPAENVPSVFLDIAMSNVASLKVVQAIKDGKSVPDSWIIDKDGLPTTDPSHYPDEGAMQPMVAHKGYGLSIMVDLLTGAINGGGMSMMGDIVSWYFHLDKPNNVCHTMIAIDPAKFIGADAYRARVEGMAEKLHNAPKAKGYERIYMPGEIEWNHYAEVEKNGLVLPDDVVASLTGLVEDIGIKINWEDAK